MRLGNDHVVKSAVKSVVKSAVNRRWRKPGLTAATVNGIILVIGFELKSTVLISHS